MDDPIMLLDLADPYLGHAVRWTAAVVLLVCAVAANGLVRVAVRYLIRRAVRRALAGRGRWTLRHPRLDDDGLGEVRRLQRADAAAHMIARLATLAVLALALLMATSLVRIDPLVMLSSAGFLGAGLAMAGQSVVRDWLTGLIVLLEDRYATGDRVSLQVGGETSTGVVEILTGLGLRLRLDDGTTWHTGHGSIESVVNHSQRLVSNDIEIPSEVWDELGQSAIGRTVHAASHDLGLTDVLLASDIEARGAGDGTTTVTVQASRPLNNRQRALLVERISGSDRSDDLGRLDDHQPGGSAPPGPAGSGISYTRHAGAEGQLPATAIRPTGRRRRPGP